MINSGVRVKQLRLRLDHSRLQFLFESEHVSFGRRRWANEHTEKR